MNEEKRIDSGVVLFGEVVTLAESDLQMRPGVMDKMHAWSEALDLFLSSRRAANTSRSYRHSLQEFLAYSGKMPWDIGKDDCQRWTDALRRQGLTDETINLKIAAISSFYSFAMNDYEIVHPDGRKSGLTQYNPAASKSLRAKVTPYGKAISLSTTETRALLKAIRRDTVQGLRDFALFLAYLYTGRRNSEIRMLKWGALRDIGGRIMYQWSGKGKKDMLFELPTPVYAAIRDYLQAEKRLEGMQEGDYIFTPLNDNALWFKQMAEETWDRNRPLSMREVGSLLKKYARKAGLDAKKVHVHTLRHTAAHLRLEAGDSLEVISDFLSHSSLAVTQIYIQRTEGRKDGSWSKVEALIGL